jgi:hypothetical protein
MVWTTHHWVFLYVAIVVCIVYVPPKAFKGLGSFIHQHFGDSMGVYMLHLSIALVCLGSVYSIAAMSQVGQTLLTTAMAILKFTKDAVPLNGAAPTVTGSTPANPPQPAVTK